ncbi:MAG: radical SAM protein [bacterium]
MIKTNQKRVFLIYPPAKPMNREDRCQQPIENLLVIPPLPPTDLMYMASIAESLGYICKITDYSLDNLNIDNFINDIKEFQPDYLVINTATPTLQQDLKVCSAAKKIFSDIQIIAKGAYFLKFSKETLNDFPDLDMIIRGEPEITLLEILSAKDKKDILGLTWLDKYNNKIILNSDRPFNDDLDSLPFPARHLIDNKRYIRPDNRKIQGVVKVSRGCPYHCFFCLATPVSGKKVRTRSPENILKEVKICIEKYGMRDFLFWSDIFNLDKKWATDLCNTILASGLKFNWASNTRIDTIDIETAKLMYKAGCKLVSIGIESGNQEILNKMGKKITLAQIRESIKILKKVGMEIYGYFVVGLPWETKETIEDTIKFAVELDCDFVNFYTAVAFPGTRFYDYVLENNLFDPTDTQNNLYKNAYYYPVVKTHYLNKDEIFELHKKAVKSFYLRPGYILRNLLKIRSLNELKSYIRAGLSIIGT